MSKILYNKVMSIPEIQKLKWRCRLGMLELDLLFGDFANEHVAVLSASDRQLLSDLLSEDNDVLERWLITETATTPARYTQLCQRIRDCAQDKP